MSDTPQWFETDPALMSAEIEAMGRMCPEATHGFLDDGRMFWRVPLGVGVEGVPSSWEFLAIYRDNHPTWKPDSSVRIYPVSPSEDELLQMARDAGIERNSIPHTIRDSNGLVISCETPDQVRSLDRGMIPSAASYVPLVKRWIAGFALWLHHKGEATQWL